MSAMHVWVEPSPIVRMIVLICFFWPFVAVPLLSSRGRSAGPAAAVLVPLAVSEAGMWLGLASVTKGLSIYGGGDRAAAAGIAEALSMLYLGGFSAALVIVFAAIRQHRPIVDRLTAGLFSMFIAGVAGALIAAPLVSSRAVSVSVLIGGAVFATVTTVVAIVWTFLTGRGRVAPGPLPHGVAVVAIAIVVTGVIVWELVHGYTAFAMGLR